MNNIFKLQNDYLADLKNWKIGEVNIALTALNEIKRGEKKRKKQSDLSCKYVCWHGKCDEPNRTHFNCSNE